ncbi:DUF6158 family protein [Frankia sp. Cppng1_Ct_nod]|uniref:DUF6158 family protein n=1 Tax=Frankia sp. Cppng1_Ct_nod TaxID=2897162 RepID=UPI0020244C3D|nr:DUF6158 family protein [Frankia sp. Cppng1_Ct_nod]
MTHRPDGIPPAQLSDEDLAHEVEHLHETRHETFLHGSSDAFETHTARMLSLEHEYLRRFAGAIRPDPRRTRAGSRRAAAQSAR